MDERIIYNTIGIAIINTDRIDCLTRLITSFIKNTESKLLNSIRVHVVDDSSEPAHIENRCKQFGFIDYHYTGKRIGVARNTNEALYLLRDKELSFIFNNDCEILHKDWLMFYQNAMMQTNIHHFCFQQEGLWGAGTKKRPQEIKKINDINIKIIQDYPQGALLVYDKLAFNKVGYFDSKAFEGYGRSHWDWSFRISESGIQIKGFIDAIDSNKYIKVHDEKCITSADQRTKDYIKNSEIYQMRVNGIRSGTIPIYTEK
jgi:hypothetical protein